MMIKSDTIIMADYNYFHYNLSKTLEGFLFLLFYG